MAMMTPAAFVAHVDHEVARKFLTDILNLLEPKVDHEVARKFLTDVLNLLEPKPEPKAKPKKAKPEGKEGEEIEDK